jgi:hypothetical protein
VFIDVWNEDRMPRAVDKLERSPTELQRMVQAYLPERLGLVALGITTNIPDLVQQGFIGSEVIVLDGSMDRTRFLHNELGYVFGRDVQVVHSGAGEPSAGSSTDTPTSSREQSPSHILQQTSEDEVHGTVGRGKQYWDTSDDSEGGLYSPSQSTDADEDRMEFVVEEEAEEDDGTRIEETPQVHSVNEVVARAQELDVQVVVSNTTAENTPIRILESPEA